MGLVRNMVRTMFYNQMIILLIHSPHIGNKTLARPVKKPLVRHNKKLHGHKVDIVLKNLHIKKMS